MCDSLSEIKMTEESVAEEIKRPRALRFASDIRRFISDFPDLEYTGTVIYCCVCQQHLNGCMSAHDCRRHIASARHTQNSKLKHPYWLFIFDLIFTFSACGIAQWVLEKEQFRLFWNKYSPEWPLPTRQKVRSQFPYCKKRLEGQIKTEVRDKKIWVTVDETIDSRKNMVGNVLIRILSPTGPSNSYLIASKRLEETNSETIQQLVQNALNKFGVQPLNVLMLVTDGATYMRSAGALLKTVYPNLLHVTCLLHAFHIVGEEIRSCYHNVDKLISSTDKSRALIKVFHKDFPGIPDPPRSVLTRWETWPQAAFYYYEHFEKVKSLIFTFDPRVSNHVKESQQQFSNVQVRRDLLIIHNNYNVLADAIEKFRSGLSLSQSLEVVDRVNLALQTLTDDAGVRAAKRYQDVLAKNPDISKLSDLKNLPSDGNATNLQQFLAYANITSLDVEHSFSKYMSTCTSRRTNLSEGTVEGLLMIQGYAENYKQSFMDQE